MGMNPRGIETLTKILMIMLYIGLGLAVISSSVLVMLISDEQSVKRSDWRDILEGITAIMLLATYLVFGRWLWVTSRNLWDWQVDGLSYSPASGIYWHAVPIASWFIPYRAMTQIWNGSFGVAGPALDEGNSALRLWWAFWLTNNLLATYALIAFRDNITPPSHGLITALVDIGLYWFASRIVSTIGAAQTQGLAALEKTFA